METIKKGSRGDAVKTLQNCLGLKADGIFGTDAKAEKSGKIPVLLCNDHFDICDRDLRRDFPCRDLYLYAILTDLFWGNCAPDHCNIPFLEWYRGQRS